MQTTLYIVCIGVTSGVYVLARWLWAFSTFNEIDQVALSFVAALVYLAWHTSFAWSHAISGK